MPSAPVERLDRCAEIETNEAPERARPDRDCDRVPGGADGEQVPVAQFGRIGRGDERSRRAAAERLVAGEQRAGCVEDGGGAQVDGERPEPGQGGVRGEWRAHRPAAVVDAAGAAPVLPARDNGSVPFTRIAWLATVLACVVTGVALLLSGYQGYAAVFGAVGACAAINLR
jgi:hypothetical protein